MLVEQSFSAWVLGAERPRVDLAGKPVVVDDFGSAAIRGVARSSVTPGFGVRDERQLENVSETTGNLS